MVRNQQTTEHVLEVVTRHRFWRASRSLDRSPLRARSCVGLDVLHNDDDLPVRTLRDRVPDRQAVRRKMETVGTWQRIYLGKRVGERRDWLFEQVKDRPVGGVPQWLRQSFKLLQVLSGKRRTRSLTNSPRLRQFLASESTAFPGV